MAIAAVDRRGAFRYNTYLGNVFTFLGIQEKVIDLLVLISLAKGG